MRSKSVAHTLAEVRKGLWPGPVYEAHFTDGTTGRMSFWSKAGKPFDFDRGRRVLAMCNADKTIVAGYVERDAPREPWVRVPDPFFNGAVEQEAPRKRVTARQLRTALQAVLDTLPPASETVAASEARALL